MPRINSKCIPQKILLKMDLQTQRELGYTPPEEVRAKDEAKEEKVLQKDCEEFLGRHEIEYLHLSIRAREKSGWPDLVFVANGTPFAVELKTATGKVSGDQVRVLAWMRRNGWQVHVLRSYDRFVEIVSEALISGKTCATANTVS